MNQTLDSKTENPGVQGRAWFGFAVAGIVLIVLLCVSGRVVRELERKPLLLLPMIGALDNCLLSRAGEENAAGCAGHPDSAMRLVNATLEQLGPRYSADGAYEVGYTLNVPLLRLFRRDDQGAWRIDSAVAKRVANTIRDVDRPVLLYLFSTHFGVGGEMEAHLMLDKSNVASTVDGPLPKDKYYHIDIFPWSVARTDNELSLRRQQAMEAVLEEVCRLDYADRKKVKGVTVLGEVHQLFPGFESGMGYDSQYRITDYSDASRIGFQAFLRNKFLSIRALNEAMGADYRDFSEVAPPSLDIQRDRLARFHEHIDAYAAGVLPVSGWVHAGAADRSARAWVHVLLNGLPLGRVPVLQGRQDVLAALPELGSADVGWRYDIDFSTFTPGVYQIDVAVEREDGSLEHLGMRTVGVGDRAQGALTIRPQHARPAWAERAETTRFSIDTPQDHVSVYFNPLVSQWHAYRQSQVTAYLQHHAAVVRRSCLGREAIYTHQIVPFTNPGWDASRFAIDDSLGTGTGLSLGISLYGEPIYGTSVLGWLKARRALHPSLANRAVSRPYGITEFHPLRAMAREDFRASLERHRLEGARFVSFFLEPRWAGGRIEPGMNLFSFDPDNKEYGSDALYGVIVDLLSSKAIASQN